MKIMRSKFLSACLVAALLTPATLQAQQRFNKALRDFVSKVKENAGKTAKRRPYRRASWITAWSLPDRTIGAWKSMLSA